MQTGRFERAITKLVGLEARVRRVESVAERFRLVTLEGEDLRDREWVPGDFLQVFFRGFQHRAYTPLVWSASDGVTTFLAYVHDGDGVGASWASRLRAGETCHIRGPRGGIELTTLARPAIFFGDETSVGTAAALHATAAGQHGIRFLFEGRSLDALTAIGGSNDARLVSLEEAEREITSSLVADPRLRAVLTGNALSIQRIYKSLRREGVPARRVKNVPYWTPGRRGHSHF